MLLESIGWLGGLIFAICGFPQALLSYKQGHSEGISWAFLNMWLSGEVLTLIYVAPKGHLPLIFNYLFNILFIIVIIKYKLWPRES